MTVFETRFGLGDEVSFCGLKGIVLGVKFMPPTKDANGVEFRVRFKNGGADAWIPDWEVR